MSFILISIVTNTRTHRYKKNVFNNLIAKGANMVIPETAADPIPGLRGRAVDWLKRLRQANYSVVMTCVHASRNKCTEQGRGREVKEGKKYNNMSWSWAMSKVDQIFNYARELGYTRETFFVFDNTDWSKRKVLRVPPHHDLRVQLMYVVETHSLENNSTQTPTNTGTTMKVTQWVNSPLYRCEILILPE